MPAIPMEEQSTSVTEGAAPASSVPRRLGWFLLLAFACIGCDQATKRIASEALPRNEVLSYAGDTFRLQYAENTGAFLGFGSSLDPTLRWWLFVGATTAILVGAVVFLLRSDLPRSTFVAWTMVVGGGVGNLLDRASQGFVVDFLNLGVGSLRTGIFNVADVAILAGVIFLVLFGSRKPQEGAEPV